MNPVKKYKIMEYAGFIQEHKGWTDSQRESYSLVFSEGVEYSIVNLAKLLVCILIIRCIVL